jgi:oligoribonuclease NrnB/cAMP/cGMP phosphodiesterase (DHH superfamily)
MTKYKPFLIVAHNDLDGGASAICVINHIYRKYSNKATCKLAFKTYKNINPFMERVLDNPKRYEKVFIVDISVEAFLAEQFPDNIILLDHHDTASELNKFDSCIVDVSGKYAGATLCYKHLMLNEGWKDFKLKKLVCIAQDYDLWTHKYPHNIAKNLNFIYYYYWGEKFVERFNLGFDGFNDEEKRLKRSTNFSPQ